MFDGNIPIPAVARGIIVPQLATRLEDSKSEYIFESLKEQIEDFENSLGDRYEAALKLASFGSSIIMSVEKIEYENPVLLFFTGAVDGKPARLVQNVSQLNFLIMAVPVPDDRPKRRIGFGAE